MTNKGANIVNIIFQSREDTELVFRALDGYKLETKRMKFGAEREGQLADYAKAVPPNVEKIRRCLEDAFHKRAF